jgi:hypothetical protein
MSRGGPIMPVPGDAPKVGEMYRHYKGDDYKVLDLALNSNDDEWMVVYEPIYDEPVAHLFTRPLSEWHEMVEWEGKMVPRFSKI